MRGPEKTHNLFASQRVRHASGSAVIATTLRRTHWAVQRSDRAFALRQRGRHCHALTHTHTHTHTHAHRGNARRGEREHPRNGGEAALLCTPGFSISISSAALGWEHGRPTPAIATHRCKPYTCDSTFLGGEAKLPHGPYKRTKPV
jgi:hypothetical protein